MDLVNVLTRRWYLAWASRAEREAVPSELCHLDVAMHVIIVSDVVELVNVFRYAVKSSSPSVALKTEVG